MTSANGRRHGDRRRCGGDYDEIAIRIRSVAIKILILSSFLDFGKACFVDSHEFGVAQRWLQVVSSRLNNARRSQNAQTPSTQRSNDFSCLSFTAESQVPGLKANKSLLSASTAANHHFDAHFARLIPLQ